MNKEQVPYEYKEGASLHMVWLDSVSAKAIQLSPVPASCGFTGFPSPAQDHTQRALSLDQYLNIRENTTWYFLADGDSMEDMGITNGDVLVVDSSLDPVPGDVCICIVEAEYVAKIVDVIKGVPHLISANKKYAPIAVETVQVFGVVTGRVSLLRKR
jgi:DNA polymerase V